MRYRAFRRKKDNLFYFQFLSENNDVLLNSQSYADKDTCFNGIRSVISNANDDNRYEKSIDGDGKHFFILKAGNGQEIGRSVKYDSEGALDTSINRFISEGPKATSKTTDQTEEKEGAKPAAPAQGNTDYQQGARSSDDYRPLAFYESRISGTENGFDQFDADDGEFYFTYNLANKVLLISEGYKTAKSRDNGISSVTKNLPIEARYQKQVHENGKHYFNLRAGNNQEIATSRWFDSEGAMDSAIGILRAGGSPSNEMLVSAGLLAASANPSDSKIYKDYKPLSFYQENIAGETFGYDSFEKDDAYYFSVNQEGNPVLISEDYTSESGRDNGIKSVKKNVKNEARYVRMVHPNGMHYFNLLAGNKQEIATSRWFESKKDMEKAIYWLTNTGGTRRRKKAATKKPAAERTYIQQGQPYLCNNITYDTFQSGGNQKFYFVFRDKDQKAVLINGDVRGFKTQEDLEAGIKDVLKYGSKDAKYDIRSTKNGKVYFYIQNEDGKNVARSSLFYDTDEDMRKAMALLQCVGATMVGAAPAAPKSNAVVDDYLPCERYRAEAPRFNTFYDEDRKEYYFSYNDNDGNVLLRSEGYTTEAARDNGIASVQKNAPLEERWTKGTALNDKYYYYALKAGNHQEIARSCYSDNEADMLAAFALTGKMFVPEPEPVAAAPISPEAVVDDYLPCASYAGENGFHTFTHEDNGEHYFAYNRASDGKTLLRSEGYTQTASRDNGIQSVIKNAPIEARWGTDTALNDKYHYYFLKAGNNQEIARSCYYSDKAAMLLDLGWIQGEDSPVGFGSALVGGTMMSAGMLRLAAEEEAAAKAKAEAEAEALRLKAAEEEKAAAAALAAAAAAKAAADAKAKAEAEAAAAKAEAEKVRLAAEAKAKEEAEALRLKAAEEEKAAAAAAAKAAADAKAKAEAEAAAAKAEAEKVRLAAETKAKEEKAAAVALAAAAAAKAAADAAAKKKAEEARIAMAAKAEEEKAKAAAIAAAAASAKKEEATAAAAYASGGGAADNGGCMKWLLPALIALALIALILFLCKDCLGCNKEAAVAPKIEKPVDPAPKEPEPDPVPYGKDGDGMGYNTGTLEYNMANHLSGFGSTFPSGQFDADGVTFGRNSSRLNAAARKQLDNVIALLKEYPDAKIDIYGFLTDNESGTGNKEISLDDQRAKKIYNYLKKGGIDESRMNFQGDGVGDRRGASIRVISR